MPALYGLYSLEKHLASFYMGGFRLAVSKFYSIKLCFPSNKNEAKNSDNRRILLQGGFWRRRALFSSSAWNRPFAGCCRISRCRSSTRLRPQLCIGNERRNVGSRLNSYLDLTKMSFLGHMISWCASFVVIPIWSQNGGKISEISSRKDLPTVNYEVSRPLGKWILWTDVLTCSL